MTHLQILIDAYEQAPTIVTGKHRTTINELTDQIPAIRSELLREAVYSLTTLGPFPGTKLLVEEDKGAILGGVLCEWSGLPLAIARWYAYEIPEQFGSLVVPVSMEYTAGNLRVNGLQKGDRVHIIDDTLSTGGTLISMLSAIETIGAIVVDIRVVVEKIGNGGREKIKLLTGLDVKAVIGIEIDAAGKVHVVEVFGERR